VVIMIREIGITVLRFLVLRHGIIPASRGGKAKTVVQTLAIGLYLLPLPELLGGGAGIIDAVRWIVLGAAVVLTVVTGLDYVLRALRLRAAASTTLPESP
jgi:CDP-diacylglycerol--glycerol-3-phosphate 3-phosphatidyltransferase